MEAVAGLIQQAEALTSNLYKLQHTPAPQSEPGRCPECKGAGEIEYGVRCPRCRALEEQDFRRKYGPRAPSLAPEPRPTPLAPGQVKHMVDRFLAWSLPPDFQPDGGVSFDPSRVHVTAFWPIGTNILTATQAEAMVRHMVEGLPAAEPRKEPERWIWDEIESAISLSWRDEDWKVGLGTVLANVRRALEGT